MRRRLSIAAWAALFLGTALHSHPAAAQPEIADSFGETLDVVVVGVEAVVTDRSGARVSGLGPADFRLILDGRETEIEYFTEIRDGHAVAVPGRSPEVDDGEPRPNGDARVTTNHLVFIDDFFSIRAHRNSVLEGMRADFAQLPPGDRMALVAFDGDDLDVLTGWTDSKAELERAFDRAMTRRTKGLFRASERLRRGEEGPWVDPTSQSREMHRVITAIRSTLQVLPRPEGRKVLLLLGGGWPVDLFLIAQGSDGGSTGFWDDQIDDRDQATALADIANLLGYTVYPVDVAGLRNREAAVEKATLGPVPDGTDTPRPSGYAGDLLRQDTLRFLAERTGGRALLFAERQDSLASVVEDTRSYYSLGFTSRLGGDGSLHSIRLEARRDGLRVRGRESFQDVTRSEQLDLLVESSLRFHTEGSEADGLAPGSDEASALQVTLGKPRPADRRTMEMNLRLSLPWREITLLPSGGGTEARLEVRIAVRDRRGEMSEIATQPFVIRGRTAPDPDAHFQWGTPMTLRRERHTLVVSVYDTLGGKILTRRLTVEP